MYLKRARAHERAGRYRASLRATTQAMAAVEVNGSVNADRLRARAMAFRAIVRMAQERPSDTVRAGLAAIEAAERSGERQGLAQALSMVETASRMLGQPAEDAYVERALAIYEELGDFYGQATMYGNLGFEAYFTGDWTAAIEHYQRAIAAFDRCGDAVGAAQAATGLGEIRVCQGRYTEAEPVLVDASRSMRAMGFVDGAAFAAINLARARLGCGRVHDGAELLDEVIDDVTSLDLGAMALEAAIYRAECDVRLGRADAALERLRVAEREAGEAVAVHGAAMARVEALALGASGRLDLAREALGRGMERARAQGLVYELAQLLTVTEALDPDAGPEVAAEADELRARLGMVSPASELPVLDVS